MAKTIGDLLVELGVDATALSMGLGAAESRIEKFGTRMFFLGSRISLGVGAPLTLAAGAVAKFGMEFDKAMTESLAIVSNVTPKIRADMESVAQQVAKTTKFSATEAAEGYYSLASAGLDAATSMGALPVAARFAQAGVMDLAKSTEYLAGAQAALGSQSDTSAEKVAQMAHIADVLTEANNRALGTIEDFAQALSNNAGSIMRQFKIPVEQGVAVLAAFASQNIKGAKAGTYFMMTVRDLTTHALKSADAFKKWGVHVFDAKGNLNNMADIVNDLSKAFSGLSVAQQTQALREMGIPQRSLHAIRALLGYGDAIKTYQKQLEEAGGVTQRVADNQMKALSNQWLQMKHEAEIAAIAIFKSFIPVIKDYLIPFAQRAITALNDLASFFAKMPVPLRAVTVGVLALAAALGPIIYMVGSFSLAAGGLVKGLSVLAGGVGTMATTFGLAIGSTKYLSVAQANAMSAANLLAFAQAQVGSSARAAAIAQGLNAGQALNAAKVARAGVTAQNALAIATTGVATSATLMGRAWTIATGPIGLTVLALAALAVVIYKVSNAQSDLQKEFGQGSEEFKTHSKVLEDALSTYDNLYNRQSLNREESDRLSKAIRTLAEASGVSEAAFRDEANKSDTLTAALYAQAHARKEVLESMVLSLRNEASQAQSDLDAAKDRLNALLQGKTKIVEGSDRGGDLIQRDMTGSERANEYTRLEAQIVEMGKKADETRKKLDKLTGARGTADLQLPGGEGKDRDPSLPPLKVPPPVQGGMPPLGEDKLSAAAKKAKTMFEDLMGTGKSTLATMKKVWAEHADEIRNTEGRLVEFGSMYADVIDKTGLKAPELSEALSAFENDEWSKAATAHFQDVENAYAGFSQQVGAEGQKIIKFFGVFEQAFQEAQNVGTPEAMKQFWAVNGKGMEDLIPVVDKLGDTLQSRVRAFEEWKMAATDAAARTGDAFIEAQKDITDAVEKIGATLEDKKFDVQLLTAGTLNAGILTMKKGMGKMRDEQRKVLVKMAQDIMLHLPKAEQAAAWERYRIAEQNSEEIVKLANREGILRLAQQMGFSDRWMRKMEQMTDEEILQLLRSRRAWQEKLDVMKDILGLNSAGGSLAKALGLDSLAKAMEDIGASMAQFQKGMTEVAEAENVGQTITGWMDAAAGVVSGVKTMMNTVGRGNRAMQGAMMGAQLGTMIMPGIGTAVGAGIGAIAGALMKDPRWSQTAKRLGERFGAEFSEETAKAIEKDADKFAGSLDAAAINNMDKLISEAGGLNTGNIGEFTKMFHDIFSMIETGQMTVAQATTVVDKNFGTFAQNVIDSNEVASGSFVDLIALVHNFGVESKSVMDFLTGQTGKFGQAMSAVLTFAGKPAQDLADKIKAVRDELAQLDNKKGSGDFKKKTEELNKLLAQQATLAAGSRAEAERLGVVMLTTFNAGMANGLSWVQMIQQMGPSIGQLSKMFQDLGITSDNAAVKTLAMYGTMVSENMELFNAVDGLNQALIAMSTIPGAVTQESFQGVNDQLKSMHDKVLAIVTGMGGTELDALMPFIPTLENIIKLHKERGLVIDENTQKLIDQAEAAGLINDEIKSTTDIMALGFAGMIEALGGQVPAALQKIVDRLNGVGVAGQDAANTTQTAFAAAAQNVSQSFNDVGQHFLEHITGFLPTSEDMKRVTSEVQKALSSGTVGKFAPEFMADLGKQIDTIGPMAVDLFKTLTDGMGMTAQAALTVMRPGLQTIVDVLTATGVTADGAFGELLKQFGLIGDAAAPTTAAWDAVWAQIKQGGSNAAGQLWPLMTMGLDGASADVVKKWHDTFVKIALDAGVSATDAEAAWAQKFGGTQVLDAWDKVWARITAGGVGTATALWPLMTTNLDTVSADVVKKWHDTFMKIALDAGVSASDAEAAWNEKFGTKAPAAADAAWSAVWASITAKVGPAAAGAEAVWMASMQGASAATLKAMHDAFIQIAVSAGVSAADAENAWTTHMAAASQAAVTTWEGAWGLIKASGTPMSANVAAIFTADMAGASAATIETWHVAFIELAKAAGVSASDAEMAWTSHMAAAAASAASTWEGAWGRIKASGIPMSADVAAMFATDMSGASAEMLTVWHNAFVNMALAAGVSAADAEAAWTQHMGAAADASSTRMHDAFVKMRTDSGISAAQAEAEWNAHMGASADNVIRTYAGAWDGIVRDGSLAAGDVASTWTSTQGGAAKWVESAYTGCWVRTRDRGTAAAGEVETSWFALGGTADGLASRFGGTFSAIRRDGVAASNDIQLHFDRISVDPIDIRYRYRQEGDGPQTTFSMNVPVTAVGGVVTGPQVRMVGEEGPEAIIPIDRLFDKLDTLYGQPAPNDGDGEMTLVFNIAVPPGSTEEDGRRFGRAFLNEVRRGGALRSQLKSTVESL